MPFDDFSIDIPQAQLDDLHQRLEHARWPDQLDDVGWSYGVELGRLKELAERWRTQYDWRVFEERANALSQQTTRIDGQRVHFFHVRSASTNATPLLLTHGWPGSGADFLDLAEELSDEFHLVIPTIPGFGFSGPTTATGWDVDRIAAAWAVLMNDLGYHRYGVHGGDWGAKISPALARLHPDRVIGLHMHGFTAFPSNEADLETWTRTTEDGSPESNAGNGNAPATLRSRAPAHKHSPTDSSTPRSASLPGTSNGSTTTAITSARSPTAPSSTTSPSPG
jgi:hypothetical protein